MWNFNVRSNKYAPELEYLYISTTCDRQALPTIKEWCNESRQKVLWHSSDKLLLKTVLPEKNPACD